MKCSASFLVSIFLVAASFAAVETDPAAGGPPLSFSFSERLRLLSWNNVLDLDDETKDSSTFTRHRSSLGLNIFHEKTGIAAAIRLTNEFRFHFEPDDTDFTFDELFVENLYLEKRGIAGVPLTLTLGRQDIILGEGFSVLEAHPLDGSRSIYFNALRLDWDVTPDQRLTGFCSYQTETEEYFPVFSDREEAQNLLEQPEEGLCLYYSGGREKTVDIYFIRKKIEDPGGDLGEITVHAVGERLVIPKTERLSFTGEGVFEFGRFRGSKLTAAGGHFHADYRFTHPSLGETHARGGAVLLSGDNPDTPDDHEGWEPLFARWPKWSESYIYTLIPENGGKVAYWSNFASVYGDFACSPFRGATLSLALHHLLAQEPPSGDAAFPGGSGRIRGNLLIAELDFKLYRFLTGHILWEIFNPGSYYFSGADGYSWFRFELSYTGKQ